MADMKKVNLVKDVTKRKESEMLSEIGDIERMLLKRQQQLDALTNFQKEYLERGVNRDNKINTAGFAQNFEQFMRKISEAISQEQGSINTLKQSRAEQYKNLQEISAKLDTLDAMLLKLKKIESVKEDKREQVYVDDLLQHKKRDNDF